MLNIWSYTTVCHRLWFCTSVWQMRAFTQLIYAGTCIPWPLKPASCTIPDHSFQCQDRRTWQWSQTERLKHFNQKANLLYVQENKDLSVFECTHYESTVRLHKDPVTLQQTLSYWLKREKEERESIRSNWK